MLSIVNIYFSFTVEQHFLIANPRVAQNSFTARRVEKTLPTTTNVCAISLYGKFLSVVIMNK